MFRVAVPVLGVSSSLDAEAFYCDKLGFRRIYAYRPKQGSAEPGYVGVARDGAQVALSSFPGDGPPGGRVIQIYVDDVRAVRDELVQAGVKLEGDVMDQTWGNLEINLVDPDGNRIVIAQDKGG